MTPFEWALSSENLFHLRITELTETSYERLLILPLCQQIRKIYLQILKNADFYKRIYR